MFGWIAEVYIPSFAEIFSGASKRSLSALLWLGKVFVCLVGDGRLSEQIRRGVSFGGRLEVHLGNARFFSTDVH